MMQYWVSITDFPAKILDFSSNHRIFPQIHRKTLENSKVLPIRPFVRRTDNYPILKPFPFSITKWRYGGVRAQEGHKKVPDRIVFAK